MKIICEHCGTNIDTLNDNICPNCKAPYNKNKEFLRKKDEQEKFEKETVEFGKNVFNKAWKTSKIVFVVWIIIFLIVVFGIITIFGNINRNSTNKNSFFENITDTNKNVEINYSDIKFVDKFKWHDMTTYTAKNKYTIVLINLSIKNNTNKELYIMDNDIICSINGVVQENVSIHMENYKELPHSLMPGLIAEGYVAYEVKKGEKSFDITYEGKTIHIDAK